MPRVDLNGVSLRYKLSGKAGAPVLLLSGSLGTDLNMWEPQLKDFEAAFQVLRYDMRGHGGSSTPPGPYAIDLLGGDVLGLLDALGLRKVHFCGLSVGGVIGQWLGIHAPSRFHSVALCNTAAKIGSPDTWDARMDLVRTEGMGALVDGVMDRWFTASFRMTHSPILTAMRDAFLGCDTVGYVGVCGALRDMDQRGEVAAVGCPALILAGDYDVVTTVADGHFLESQIKGAEFAVLPAAHISSAEVPEQFNAAVLKFLARKGSNE